MRITSCLVHVAFWSHIHPPPPSPMLSYAFPTWSLSDSAGLPFGFCSYLMGSSRGCRWIVSFAQIFAFAMYTLLTGS